MFVKRNYLAYLSYEGSFLSSLLISAKMGCYWLFIKALGLWLKNQLRKEAVEKNKFYQPENIKDPKIPIHCFRNTNLSLSHNNTH